AAYGRGARSGSDWSRSYTARCEARLAPRSRSGPAMPRAASPARCPRHPAGIQEVDSSADGAVVDRARPALGMRTRRLFGHCLCHPRSCPHHRPTIAYQLASLQLTPAWRQTDRSVFDSHDVSTSVSTKGLSRRTNERTYETTFRTWRTMPRELPHAA